MAAFKPFILPQDGGGPVSQPNTTDAEKAGLGGWIDGLRDLAFTAGEYKLKEEFPEQYAAEPENGEQRDPAVDQRMRETRFALDSENMQTAGVMLAGLLALFWVLK